MRSAFENEDLIDEKIRVVVASAIEARSMIDVPMMSVAIAQVEGVRAPVEDIAMRLSEAAVAASIPIRL